MDLGHFEQALFAQAKRQGFTEMELYYERESKFHCEQFKGDVEKYETSDVTGISFRGKFQGQMGYAYTERLDEPSIEHLVESAKENAMVIGTDEREDISSGSERYEKGNFYSTSLEAVSIPEKMRLLAEIEQHVYEVDERVTGTNYCGLNSVDLTRVLRNSKGVSLEEKHNHIEVGLSVIVEHEGEIQTGMTVQRTRDYASIRSKEVAQQAVEKALAQLGARHYASRTYPVLLRNEAAAGLLQAFSPIFSAENAQKGQSLLKDQVGKAIASPLVQLVDDPFLADGMGCRSFDDEGIATTKRHVIEDGRLLTLLHNQKTARIAGTTSTGHAYRPSYKDVLTVSPSNMYIAPSQTSYEQLLSQLEEGIVITDLSGLHSGVNPVSGNFSVAAKGLFVKAGNVQSAVNRMTLAGNLYDLLHHVEDIADDLEFTLSFIAPGYVGSPSLLIKSLAVTIE